MFRQRPKGIDELVKRFLHDNSLETPLLQRRLVSSWQSVVGEVINNYTENVEIRNQTLWVKITNPALRSDLSMNRTNLVDKLNNRVGSRIITEIRFY